MTYLEYLKTHPKQKITSYKNFQIHIRKPKKVNYVDKKPTFYFEHRPSETIQTTRIERFTKIAERTGVNHLVVIQLNNKWYTLEGQEINISSGAYNKFQSPKFIEAENGTYLNGFHYFEYIRDAIESAKNEIYFYKVIEILVVETTARGTTNNRNIHVTQSFYIN